MMCLYANVAALVPSGYRGVYDVTGGSQAFREQRNVDDR